MPRRLLDPLAYWHLRSEIAYLRLLQSYWGWRIGAKYNPSQPRVPAGRPDGGQWTDGSGGGFLGDNPNRLGVGQARPPRGRGMPSNPIEAYQLRLSQAERDTAVRRARTIKPDWTPESALTNPSSNRGLIEHNRAVARAANEFYRDATSPMTSIIAPGGQPVGYVYRGATSDIRTVSREEFAHIYNRLRAGAQEIPLEARPARTYYIRHDGSSFTYRERSENGPTLDIQRQTGPAYQPRIGKIHQR